MRNNIAKCTPILGLAMAAAFSTVISPNAAAAQSRMAGITAQAGTVIPVTLDRTLTSNSAIEGDTFTATVQTGDNGTYIGLPAGTKIEGVVKTAVAHQDSDPGVLGLDFRRIALPDGRSFAIAGSLVGLDNKSVTRSESGTLTAKSTNKADVKAYVGYGAGAGLLVAILTKRNPLEDALIGAGLGYVVNQLQQNHNDPKDVVLAQGTELGVRLDQSLAIPANRTRFHRRTPIIGDYTGPSHIAILLNGQSVGFTGAAQPFLSHGVVMVPAGPVLSAAGLPFRFGVRSGGITARSNTANVHMNYGSRVAVIDGYKRVLLGAPAQWRNGVSYVPLQFLGLATGDTITWDSGSRTGILTSRNSYQDDGFSR